MVTGTLLKGYIKARIWLIPPYLCRGFTVRQIINSVTKMEIYSLCEMNKDEIHGRHGRNRGEEVHDQVKHSRVLLRVWWMR